jgi:hypothetical protein
MAKSGHLVEKDSSGKRGVDFHFITKEFQEGASAVEDKRQTEKHGKYTTCRREKEKRPEGVLCNKRKGHLRCDFLRLCKSTFRGPGIR